MSSGIWSLEIAERRHKCDYFLAMAILTYFGMPKSIADLGCGTGLYCRFFKTMGCQDVRGYEGTIGVRDLGIYDNIMTLDLTVPLVQKRYDLVLCLEVGEHISRDKEQSFIDNVCNFVNKNLVLSWAVEGQYSASGHVNCRNNDYIISEFTRRGLKLNKKLTRGLRDAAVLKYFKDTLMVFKC